MRDFYLTFKDMQAAFEDPLARRYITIKPKPDDDPDRPDEPDWFDKGAYGGVDVFVGGAPVQGDGWWMFIPGYAADAELEAHPATRIVLKWKTNLCDADPDWHRVDNSRALDLSGGLLISPFPAGRDPSTQLLTGNPS